MKAALFDLDGVIIDTEPSYSVFWGGIGREYNCGIENFEDVIKGTTLTQILSSYFDEKDRGNIIARLRRYEKEMQYVIFEGVADFLADLRKRGIKCAIVTSSNNEKMSNLWRQHPSLMDYFDAIITDEMVTKSKPDPEPYIIAARSLGCVPSDAWVFEDSFNGLKSGRAAGSKVVALATTNPAGTLVDLADMVITSFKDITVDDLPL